MSCIRGTSLQTEYKKLGDRPLGDFWYSQADRITRDFVECFNNLEVKPEKRVIH